MQDQLLLFPLDLNYIIHRNIKKYNLPDSSINFILSILHGSQKLSSICCRSGCDICNSVLKKCLQSIDEELKIAPNH